MTTPTLWNPISTAISVADIAELEALTIPVFIEGVLIYVRSSGAYYKLATSTVTADPPLVVATSLGGDTRFFLLRTGSESISNAVIFRPGAPTAPPFYETWGEIDQLVQFTQGNITVSIDSSIISPAVIPSGFITEGFGNLILKAEKFNTNPGIRSSLKIDDGSQIKNLGLVEGLEVQSAATTIPALLFDNNDVCQIVRGTTLTALPGATISPYVLNATPGSFTSFLIQLEAPDVFTKLGAVPPFEIGAFNVMIIVFLDCLRNITGGSLDGTIAGSASSSLVLAVDSSSQPSFSFPDFLGSFTHALLENAAGTLYSPATPADWVAPPPANVNSAIDRLASVVAVLNGGPIP